MRRVTIKERKVIHCFCLCELGDLCDSIARHHYTASVAHWAAIESHYVALYFVFAGAFRLYWLSLVHLCNGQRRGSIAVLDYFVSMERGKKVFPLPVCECVRVCVCGCLGAFTRAHNFISLSLATWGKFVQVSHYSFFSPFTPSLPTADSAASLRHFYYFITRCVGGYTFSCEHEYTLDRHDTSGRESTCHTRLSFSLLIPLIIWDAFTLWICWWKGEREAKREERGKRSKHLAPRGKWVTHAFQANMCVSMCATMCATCHCIITSTATRVTLPCTNCWFVRMKSKSIREATVKHDHYANHNREISWIMQQYTRQVSEIQVIVYH